MCDSRADAVFTVSAIYANSMGAFISETWYGDSYIFKCKNNIMYVYDITTGECLPLCSDPDCKHNSRDCTARTHDSRLGWKGVFIYENSLIEIMGMSGHTEIYRADTDGANRKLLAESDEFGINSACNFYADNGRLYISTKYDRFDETTEEVSTFYGFAVFDIEREEFTDITSLSDKEDTFVRSICAADGKIYALLQSNNESGVYEIAGGKIQRFEIDKTNAQKLSAVGFERGRFYYQAYTGNAPIALYESYAVGV